MVQTEERAFETSSELRVMTQPSITKACSLTATRTGAVWIVRSRSRSSSPPNSIPPFSADQDSASDSRTVISDSKFAFLSESKAINSVGLPSPSGIAMGWKSCSPRAVWTSVASSLRLKIATTPCFPISPLRKRVRSPRASIAGRALVRERTVPTCEVRESYPSMSSSSRLNGASWDSTLRVSSTCAISALLESISSNREIEISTMSSIESER